MRTKRILLSGVFAACAALPLHANEKLLVQVPAALDPSAPIAGSVKNECGVEMLVGNHVFQKVSERIPGAGQLQDPTSAGTDKVLKLSILSVQGVGGGGWSGPKAITLRADIAQNEQVIGTKVFRRKSSGGVMGGMSGTCPIMERIAVALGQDVAKWLPGAILTSQGHARAAPGTSREQSGNSEPAEQAENEPKQ